MQDNEVIGILANLVLWVIRFKLQFCNFLSAVSVSAREIAFCLQCICIFKSGSPQPLFLVGIAFVGLIYLP
jgi:hypothetical protein